MFFLAQQPCQPDIGVLHGFGEGVLKKTDVIMDGAKELLDKVLNTLIESNGTENFSHPGCIFNVFEINGKRVKADEYYRCKNLYPHNQVKYGWDFCSEQYFLRCSVIGITPIRGVLIALTASQTNEYSDYLKDFGFRIIGGIDKIPNANMGNKSKITLFGREFEQEKTKKIKGLKES